MSLHFYVQAAKKPPKKKSGRKDTNASLPNACENQISHPFISIHIFLHCLASISHVQSVHPLIHLRVPQALHNFFLNGLRALIEALEVPFIPQVPYPDWHPVPQCADVSPQKPNCEQQDA